MNQADHLPNFESPPVEEVSVGIQFQAKQFLPTIFGAFHSKIKERFPIVETRPLLPRVIENLDTEVAPTNAIEMANFFGAMGNSRVLYISDDGRSIVQLQHDRLHFNWRTNGGGIYPRFGYVRDGFAYAFAVLEQLFEEHQLAQPQITQCEVFYGNPLPEEAVGVPSSRPEVVFRPWTSEMGPEWTEPLEDLSFNARFLIRTHEGKPQGRLSVTLQTYVLPNGKSMRLELMSRGSPEASSLMAAMSFFDLGHDAIVRAFAAVTTTEMHARWKRLYG